MKKKILTLCLAAIMCVSFAACGGTASDDSSVLSSETEKQTDSDVGKVTEQDGMRKEVVYTNNSLDISGESGPIKYTVTDIQVSKLTATTDSTASLLDLEKDKEYAVVVAHFDVENTSDETISFYPDQSVMTTNTKEQINASLFLSDSVGGDFIGKVKKSGNVIFILKNSSADDLANVTIHIDAPHNDSFDSVGDPVEINIPVKN
jgi:hypothetical protein